MDFQEVRWEVEKLIGYGSATNDSEIAFTERAKRVIESAIYEAQPHGGKHVCTEHLLLALIREKDGVVKAVFDNLGVQLEKLQRELIASMEKQP